MIVVGPRFEPRRRMENVLHAMDDERPRGIVGECDDALDAQKMRAMRGAQQFENISIVAASTGVG